MTLSSSGYRSGVMNNAQVTLTASLRTSLIGGVRVTEPGHWEMIGDRREEKIASARSCEQRSG